MNNNISRREIKKVVSSLLNEDLWFQNIDKIIELPAGKAVSALLLNLSAEDELLKWRSITTIGEIFERKKVSEEYRKLIRRNIWNLTEESGGIPWGAPELIGELLYRNPKMAEEFSDILFSYVIESGNDADNYLDHEPLRAGAYWGIWRMSQKHSAYIEPFKEKLSERLEIEQSPEIAGYIYLTLQNAGIDTDASHIEKFQQKNIKIFNGKKFITLLA